MRPYQPYLPTLICATLLFRKFNTTTNKENGKKNKQRKEFQLKLPTIIQQSHTYDFDHDPKLLFCIFLNVFFCSTTPDPMISIYVVFIYTLYQAFLFWFVKWREIRIRGIKNDRFQLLYMFESISRYNTNQDLMLSL